MFRNSNKITFMLLLLFVLGLSGCVDDSVTTKTNSTQHVTLDVENGSTKDGATDASLTPLIVVKFDEKIDPHTITNSAITMQDSDGNSVKLDGVISNDENTSFYASPKEELAPHTTYKISVSNNVKAEDTNDSMGQAFTMTTGSVATPEVGIISPENNATLVPQNPILFFKFSSSVTNVNSSTVVLHRGSESGDIVPLEDIVAGANNTYAVTPKINLASSVTYYIEFTSGITNETGVSVERSVYKFKMLDMAAPIVTQLSPSDGELGITRTPTISIKFHERALGMNSENVELHKGSESGEIQPISDIEEGSGAVYTFSPVEQLDENTKYFVVLKPGICDIVGNCIDRKVTTFTTGDFSIPEVSLISPADNAERVSKTPIIKVKFSEPVINVNTNNVELRLGNELGTKVAIESITQGDDNTYTFSPTAPLNEKTKYSVVLNGGIEDLGQHSLEKTIFTFTTGDFTAPEVSMLEPLNNAIGISRTPVISLKFSEDVTNVNSNNIELHVGTESGATVLLSNITDENNIYSFTSKSALTTGTKYVLVVESGIIDTFANKLARRTFNFTTSNGIAPTVSLVSPTNNATQVALSPVIQVKFSESVTNVNTNTLELRAVTESGTKVATSAITAGANNTYSFSPSAQLTVNTKYFVVANDGITNLTGAKLKTATLSFTAGDSSKPVATMMTTESIAFDNGARYVSIQFNEPVKNVNTSNVTVNATSTSGAPVVIDTIDNSSGKYHIYMSNLAGNTTYYLTLSSGIEDNYGNKLDKKVLTFRTALSYRGTIFLTRDKKYYTCMYEAGTVKNCSSLSSFDVNITNPVTYAAVSGYPSPGKQYLYILTGSNTNSAPNSVAVYKCNVRAYSLSVSGCTAQSATNGYDARSGFISQDDKFLYFSNPTAAIVKCSIDSSTGDLSNCSQSTGNMPITSGNLLNSITYDKLSNSIYAIQEDYIKTYKCPLTADGSVGSCTLSFTNSFGNNYRGLEFSYDGLMLYAYNPGANSATIDRCLITNGSLNSSCIAAMTPKSGEFQSYGMEFIDKKVLYTSAQNSTSTGHIMMCDVNQSAGSSLGTFENCDLIPNVTTAIPSTFTSGFSSIAFWKYY